MDVARESVDVARTQPTLLKHPLFLAERTALEVVRQVIRWVEVTAPVQAYLSKHHTQVLRNIPYLGSGHRAHLLDVYRPRSADHRAQLPVVLYVHGGGFEVCSKDTHWMMAGEFARRGYLVFSVNYRLAPEHPYPAGLEDVCAAYLWVLDNAQRFGGNPSRIVVAGESAGANLVSSLALVNCVERPERWARAVYRRNAPPAAVIANCGFYEVSNAHRFRELASHSWAITKHTIEQIARAYLPRKLLPHEDYDLADPLRWLEGTGALNRPLPPFFISCGTGDPILHDSLRLETALRRRGVPHRARYYDGEIHAFHAMWWREASKALWRDTLEFLAEQFSEQAQVTTIAA
jgi:acetyl esterase